jgi:hypothetical protein
MADTRRLELKLKKLRAIEGDYRSQIRRAEDEYKRNLIPREKFLKIKRRCEMRMEALLPKIRKLTQLRSELRARGG